MAYHSKNGQEFVGLRSQMNDCHQIAYDNQPDPRVVFAIKDPKANLQDIDDALREGVQARNVLSGVLTALKDRDIGLDIRTDSGYIDDDLLMGVKTMNFKYKYVI